MLWLLNVFFYPSIYILEMKRNSIQQIESSYRAKQLRYETWDCKARVSFLNWNQIHKLWSGKLESSRQPVNWNLYIPGTDNPVSSSFTLNAIYYITLPNCRQYCVQSSFRTVSYHVSTNHKALLQRKIKNPSVLAWKTRTKHGLHDCRDQRKIFRRKFTAGDKLSPEEIFVT